MAPKGAGRAPGEGRRRKGRISYPCSPLGTSPPLNEIVVLAEAVHDIEAARDFYEVQEVGVGDYFVDSLLSDLQRLGELSGVHPKHFDFHRMLATHFPFAIYYRESASQTQVFAVLDLRRNPTWVRKELGERFP
jgi:predicted glycoside hydrolase/deacetylase ChbG (UPF0249 family)